MSRSFLGVSTAALAAKANIADLVTPVQGDGIEIGVDGEISIPPDGVFRTMLAQEIRDQLTALTPITSVRTTNSTARINTASLTNEDQMLTPIPAGAGIYQIEAWYWYTAPAASGIRFSWNLIAPTGWSMLWWGGSSNSDVAVTTTTKTTEWTHRTAINSTALGGGHASTPLVVRATGILTLDSNGAAGNLTPRFAQSTAVNDAGVIILAGSRVVARKIG